MEDRSWELDPPSPRLWRTGAEGLVKLRHAAGHRKGKGGKLNIEHSTLNAERRTSNGEGFAKKAYFYRQGAKGAKAVW